MLEVLGAVEQIRKEKDTNFKLFKNTSVILSQQMKVLNKKTVNRSQTTSLGTITTLCANPRDALTKEENTENNDEHKDKDNRSSKRTTTTNKRRNVNIQDINPINREIQNKILEECRQKDQD